MSDSKTKPKNPKYLVTKEQHKAAWAETMAEEEESKASYRVSKAMYDIDSSQDYLERDVEAMDMVSACGANNVENIIELIKQGKTKEEIIGVLKKNDGGIEPSPP